MVDIIKTFSDVPFGKPNSPLKEEHIYFSEYDNSHKEGVSSGRNLPLRLGIYTRLSGACTVEK